MTGSESIVMRQLTLTKQGEAGGVAVDEIFSANGSELTGGKETGDGYFRADFMSHADIMTGILEHPLAPTVATEKQSTGEGRLREIVPEHQPHIFIGGGGIAEMELDSLPDSQFAVDDNGTAVFIGPHQIANEKITSPKRIAIFADSLAEK